MSIMIIVADAGRARILTAETRTSPLVEAGDFIHSESRLREQDLVSDGPGAGDDSGKFGRHSMGHEQDAHKRELKTFASELCAEIDKQLQGGELGKVYLIAPPAFLGKLRTCLSKSSADIVAGEVNKDLVNHSIDEIRAYLPKQL